MIDYQNSVIAGKYQVLKCLGAGGMGAVYLARHLMYEEFVVAVKILYPGFIRTEGTKERFKKEISALYTINHPNVVRAYDYFCEGETIGYAMEYIDGEDLLTKIQKEAQADKVCAVIMHKICLGLEAIHSAGIFHRDLKPENILISKEGDVKISDFGVAELPDTETLTQQGEVVGTPRYLAPETFLLGKSDHRSDLYSLGIIACESLTGESPFTSSSKTELLRERLGFRARQVAGFLNHCDPVLVKIIQRLVEIDPEKRYQTATEVRMDLENFIRGEAARIKITLSETGIFSKVAGLAGIAPYCYEKLTRRNNYHQSFLAIALTFFLGCAMAMYIPSKIFEKKNGVVVDDVLEEELNSTTRINPCAPSPEQESGEAGENNRSREGQSRNPNFFDNEEPARNIKVITTFI